MPKRTDEKASRKKNNADSMTFSLLADDKSVNTGLSSLFSAKSSPLQPVASQRTAGAEAAPSTATQHDEGSSGLDEEQQVDIALPSDVLVANRSADDSGNSKSRRKRKRDVEEVEDAYMRRLAREEAKEAESAAAERAAKRQKAADSVGVAEHRQDEEEVVEEEDSDAASEDEIFQEGEDVASPPPQHETEAAKDDESEKASRTVFLGNVSTSAISSKQARKELLKHLKSFFKDIPQPIPGEPKPAVQSIRFRSTPYATAKPKKAGFAKKEVMDATTKSTNAYAVYSSDSLARQAVKHLNGTIVLGRHLRVDAIAHPAKVDHYRCVFVGNLGFVDDESNIQAANEEDGREKRKPSKQPADVEEGLWRTFGKCGTVESVRVIRDSTTRVGKGIAYVQFEDGNAVEAALLYDGKKFPPLLPRKLRVSRAKAQKRNAKPTSGRPSSTPRTNGYQRKITSEEASKLGRAGKLFGRAGAARMRKPESGQVFDNGLKKPESFVFEGYRASSKGGKAGLKLGGKKKGGKPTGRSAKRGAAFKASKRAKA